LYATGVARCRSVGRASQAIRQNGRSKLNETLRLPFFGLPRVFECESCPCDLFRERPASAHRETVNLTGHCLRRRFSNAKSVLRFGCGLPVTSTGVPLQTPHKLMRDASTVRHCLRIASAVKHIFSSHFLHHILWREKHLRKSTRGVPRGKNASLNTRCKCDVYYRAPIFLHSMK
jgi:hypothetical protein